MFCYLKIDDLVCCVGRMFQIRHVHTNTEHITDRFWCKREQDYGYRHAYDIELTGTENPIFFNQKYI